MLKTKISRLKSKISESFTSFNHHPQNSKNNLDHPKNRPIFASVSRANNRITLQYTPSVRPFYLDEPLSLVDVLAGEIPHYILVSKHAYKLKANSKPRSVSNNLIRMNILKRPNIRIWGVIRQYTRHDHIVSMNKLTDKVEKFIIYSSNVTNKRCMPCHEQSI